MTTEADGPPLLSLGEGDLSRACDVLTESFSQDPFFSYILGEGHAKALAAPFHVFTLRYGMKYGKVYASSENIEGVAIWLPPGSTKMTAWRSITAGALTLVKVYPRNLAARRGDIYGRLSRYGTYSAMIHEKHAPFPHWYLMAIGVADAHRGKGHASRLLRPVLEYLDSRGLPCFLETHNPANPALYRHFGFEVVEEGLLPGTDRPHWAMLRPGSTIRI